MTTPAGYSKRSLAEKLGIKAKHRIALLNMPDNYLLETLVNLPPDVTIQYALDGKFDVIQFFTKQAIELSHQFPVLKEHLQQAGSLWISWPKQASKVPTDLTDNVVREIGLSAGLVDIKGCAVDQVWSGLKFVYRVKDRVKENAE